MNHMRTLSGLASKLVLACFVWTAVTACQPSDAGARRVAAEDGLTLSLTAGERISLFLTETASTGYVWRAAVDDDTVLTLIATEHSERSAMAGAEGVVDFILEAIAPGTTTVRFDLARAWEKDAAETRTVSVTVSPKP